MGNNTCHNVEVDLTTCTATVDDIVTSNSIMDGIRVRQSGSRVRIAVPNCADTLLVMTSVSSDLWSCVD